MKQNALSEQVFSVVVALIFVSASYLLLIEDALDEEYDMRVPVWARGQLDYDTSQPYSFVLNQGTYELLETDNEFESVHVMIPYALATPLLRNGSPVLPWGVQIPYSTHYWNPLIGGGSCNDFFCICHTSP